MKTYYSFNELVEGQNHHVSGMSVFNMYPEQAFRKAVNQLWNDPNLNVGLNQADGITICRVRPYDLIVGRTDDNGNVLNVGDVVWHDANHAGFYKVESEEQLFVNIDNVFASVFEDYDKIVSRAEKRGEDMTKWKFESDPFAYKSPMPILNYILHEPFIDFSDPMDVVELDNWDSYKENN